VSEDGRFAVHVGASDIGTGARTAMLQIAAESLETERENIDLTIGQSASGRAALAGGSMGTSSWGWAVAKAGRALREAIDQADGVIGPEGIEVIADTEDDIAQRDAMARHTFGAQFAAVRVDIDTGQVKVDRMLGVFAAGRIINRRTAQSQYYGGMIMGLGQALLERSEIDPRFGDFANHDLASYHVASHADVPQLEVVMLEEEDRSPNPIRAKGIGELSQIGAAAAIANALHHATGARFRSIPIRIEDVRAALHLRR
jgi:xanthine dehydrogenase YagR molybdenum-binding subunit